MNKPVIFNIYGTGRWGRRASLHQSPPALRCVLLLVALALPGCFSERSFPMVPGHLVHLAPHFALPDQPRLSTREWVQFAHAAAADRLPSKDRDALTSDTLTANGNIVNVWSRLGVDPAAVDSFLGNWNGIEQTAQVTSPPPQIEAGHIHRPAWEGFDDVEVPVNGAILFGRLGVPDKSNEIPGSYIIITHGLFGSLDGLDMENHVEALRRAGHHVLAVEMRGHGETNCRHPEYVISFGIFETGDLLAAARWLKAEKGATRVGLVSFSLTGYESLLAAWIDGHKEVTEFAEKTLLAKLPERETLPAFNAGIFIVSAPVGIIDVADRFDPRVSTLAAPCKATFQEHIAARLAAYHEEPAYSMWALARSEFIRGGFQKTHGDFDALRGDLTAYLDMSRRDWREGVERMENVRVPVLVLSSANDPLGTAQGIAELFGRVRNPNLGVILLKEGGHMGFSALSADYYYSIMLNFFDPASAPRTIEEAPTAQASAPGSAGDSSALRTWSTRTTPGRAGG